MSNVFSLADLRDKAKANGTRYKDLDVYGGQLRLGTMSSLAVLAWVTENEQEEFAKNSGLRMLARTIVDSDGNRVSDKRPGTPEESEEITEFVANVLLEKDAEDNGKAIKAALELNNLMSQRMRDKLKNASGETTTEEQPSVSQ